MDLRHVTLATADPDALRPFYAETLGLPVSDTTEGFVVAIGASSIEFRRATADIAPDSAPTYHVAFSVPGSSIDSAADWLDTRADLLNDDGQTQFRYESLGATAVYAADPAGNVLELLARDGRAGPGGQNPADQDSADQTSPAQFGADSLLDIAEVGIVVDDVPAAAAVLSGMFDVAGSPDDEFAYLDGDGGAFVLTAPGRNWFPTTQPAVPAPLTVVATGGEGAISFDDGRVTVVGGGD